MTHHVLESLNVSRETVERLQLFSDLLEKWNERINLVSRKTIPDRWARHIEDSAQLLSWAPEHVGHWLDLGSGGGLPGLVLAIIGGDTGRIDKLTLVESDQRKCAFLREVTRILSLPVAVEPVRIESLPPQQADVISARALADLSKLLGYALPHVSPNTTLLFPKGAFHESEIAQASRDWVFDHVTHRSVTDAEAAIVEVRNVVCRQAEDRS